MFKQCSTSRVLNSWIWIPKKYRTYLRIWRQIWKFPKVYWPFVGFEPRGAADEVTDGPTDKVVAGIEVGVPLTVGVVILFYPFESIRPHLHERGAIIRAVYHVRERRFISTWFKHPIARIWKKYMWEGYFRSNWNWGFWGRGWPLKRGKIKKCTLYH